MRDSQRSKVYAAEGSVFTHGQTMTLSECQRWVNSIVSSAWWMHRSPLRSIEVIPGARGGRAWAHARTIRTSPGSRSRWVMCHELAHHLTQRDSTMAAHGPEFCANEVALVRQFLGKEQGDALKAAFRARRVKVRGVVKAKVRSVTCGTCHKVVGERVAWKTTLVQTRYFCSKHCGETWLLRHLTRVVPSVRA